MGASDEESAGEGHADRSDNVRRDFGDAACGGNLRVLDTGTGGDEGGPAGGAALRLRGRDIWKSVDEVAVLRLIFEFNPQSLAVKLDC